MLTDIINLSVLYIIQMKSFYGRFTLKVCSFIPYTDISFNKFLIINAMANELQSSCIFFPITFQNLLGGVINIYHAGTL